MDFKSFLLFKSATMIHRRKFRKCTQSNNLPTTSLPKVITTINGYGEGKQTLTNRLYGKCAGLKRNWLKETTTPTEQLVSFVLFCFCSPGSPWAKSNLSCNSWSSCLYQHMAGITGQKCILNYPQFQQSFQKGGEVVKMNKQWSIKQRSTETKRRKNKVSNPP